MYAEQMNARNVRMIEHYASPNMTYPDFEQMGNISTISHVWKLGDHYYKLAHKHYGQTKLWWVIAWFNKAPTESHLTPGQVILIPTPLHAALSFMRNIK
jgi:nucleoid-associated protein YgaU